MNQIGFLTDYQSATNIVFCKATNFIEKLKYNNYYIKISSLSENTYSYSSVIVATDVWGKLSLFVNTRNKYQEYLKSRKNTIQQFEYNEGKGIARIFHRAEYNYFFDGNPISPGYRFEFYNLNNEDDSPFRDYVRKHFNIYHFNRITIDVIDYLRFYDDRTHEAFFPKEYKTVTQLIEYILLKIGQRFSITHSISIDVPPLILVD